MKIQFDKNQSGWKFSSGFGYGMSFIYLGPWALWLYTKKYVDEMKKTKQTRAQHEKLEQRLSQQREFQNAPHFLAFTRSRRVPDR